MTLLLFKANLLSLRPSPPPTPSPSLHQHRWRPARHRLVLRRPALFHLPPPCCQRRLLESDQTRPSADKCRPNCPFLWTPGRSMSAPSVASQARARLHPNVTFIITLARFKRLWRPLLPPGPSAGTTLRPAPLPPTLGSRLRGPATKPRSHTMGLCRWPHPIRRPGARLVFLTINSQHRSCLI